MKKHACRLLAVLAVGFLAASTWTLAETSNRDGVITHEQPGGVKDFALRHGNSDGAPPVRLPMPINRLEGGIGTSPKVGLVGGGIGFSQTGGSAIVAPRGGTMMSPAERADQAIRTVIRRLG